MPADRDLIRRRALAAASSVVLAAGLAACDLDLGLSDPYTDADTAADTAAADTDCYSDGDDHPGVCVGLEGGEEWATCCEALYAWCEETHSGDADAIVECTYGAEMTGE